MGPIDTEEHALELEKKWVNLSRGLQSRAIKVFSLNFKHVPLVFVYQHKTFITHDCMYPLRLLLPPPLLLLLQTAGPPQSSEKMFMLFCVTY